MNSSVCPQSQWYTFSMSRGDCGHRGSTQCPRGSAPASRHPDNLTYPSAPFSRFIFPTTRLGAESQFSDFLDGLGPAQIVGRQTLATPPMGESFSFIYYLFSSWLCQVFTATHGLSLVAASGGSSLVVVLGLIAVASLVREHGL